MRWLIDCFRRRKGPPLSTAEEEQGVGVVMSKLDAIEQRQDSIIAETRTLTRRVSRLIDDFRDRVAEDPMGGTIDRPTSLHSFREKR
jgi:hypothetical protein